MDLKQFRARPSREAVEQAAAWFIEFRAGDLDTQARERFLEWLRRSPDNIQGYLEVAATWAETPSRDREKRINLKSYIERARAEPMVTQLRAASAASEPPTRPRARHRRWKWAAVAAAISAVAVAFWSTPGYDTYVTRVGEQRTIELADGSAVELNARSTIRVRMTARERDVQLVDGEALFRVAKDHSRPFVVRSGDMRVRAVGTQFDVYRRVDRTTVTVIEGTVAVSSEAKPASNALLTASQQLTVAAQEDAPRRPVQADVSTATAWVQKRLVFNDTPLAEVADEFNRYNTRSLIVEGEALREIRISGVYSSTDPTALIEFLRYYPGLRVVETPRAIRVERID